MPNHSRLSNSEFKDFLDALIEKADGNAAGFFLTQDLIDLVKTDRNEQAADLADRNAKRDAWRAAGTKLKNGRKARNARISLLKRTMKGNADFTPDKYVELGFDADDLTPTPVTLNAPTELSVIGFSTGTNTLRFNRNGNKSGTIFLIEAKIGNSPNFVIIGTTTKSSYNHTGQMPGVQIVYRIRAQRGDNLSEYSNTAIVYEGQL